MGDTQLLNMYHPKWFHCETGLNSNNNKVKVE